MNDAVSSGAGTIDLSGFLTLAGAVFASLPMAIAQTIEQIEAKAVPFTVPPSSTLGIPLNLSPGVTEALFVFMATNAKLKVDLTTSDLAYAGPVRAGLQGIALWTFTPGEGVTAISVINPDPVNAVVVTVCIGATADPAVVPPFWR